MWNSLAPFAHLYLFYEPLWGSANPHPLHPVDPETPGPSQAFSFAFSNYSEQSAYLVRNEQTGLIELWMADLDLCQIQRLWVDAATWFGDYSTLGETAVLKVRWGPGDKSILITQPDSDHVLIHSLSSGQDMLWSGACDRIVRSPISGRLALGCLPGEAGGEDGLVVETDGSLQSEAIQQDLLMQVLDWSFSPDSSRVSFANAEPYEVNKLKVNFYKTGIMEQDGSFLELPITWTDWRMDDDFYDFYNYKRTMQWARDGSKLLVVGLDRMLDVDACPQDGRPCWFMLDAHSGAIQWYLTHKETEFSAEEWEEVEFLYEAALSPDGKWVAMFFDWRAPFKYFVAISLDTNQAIDLGGYNGLSLYWAK
ncbi:MAG: hypothetical protein JW862_14565 [Anaerolineales bacterium]|nr:hypothetical protein [Anaerolineales bacterium]